MRLLNARTLKLEDEFYENNTPKYAILSHTWVEGEEVSCQELGSPEAAKKSGYTKIEETCKRALQDGIEYVWIDTCCIDKKSSTEISEAINSMFNWYSRASICYAYLADVDKPADLSIPVKQLQESRWFKRGWTLQELIAPSKVLLLASDWSLIAERSELSSIISRITSIDKEILSRQEGMEVTGMLNKASIAERMCWASARGTKRTEDMAYCLLGIFGINMPLLYGEGERAFIRLQREIANTYDDQSLFAWYPSSSSDSSILYGIFASSPADFASSGDIIPSDVEDKTPPFVVTNRGLHITVPMLNNGLLVSCLLRCQRRRDPTSMIVLPIEKVDDNIYARLDTDISGCASYHAWSRWPRKTIYIATDYNKLKVEQGSDKLLIRSQPRGFSIKGPSNMSPGSNMISPLSRDWECWELKELGPVQVYFGGEMIALLHFYARRVPLVIPDCFCFSPYEFSPNNLPIWIRHDFDFPHQSIADQPSSRVPSGLVILSTGVVFAKITEDTIRGSRIFSVDIQFSRSIFILVKVWTIDQLYGTYYHIIEALSTWFTIPEIMDMPYQVLSYVFHVLLIQPFILCFIEIIIKMNMVGEIIMRWLNFYIYTFTGYQSEANPRCILYFGLAVVVVYLLFRNIWLPHPHYRTRTTPFTRLSVHSTTPHLIIILFSLVAMWVMDTMCEDTSVLGAYQRNLGVAEIGKEWVQLAIYKLQTLATGSRYSLLQELKVYAVNRSGLWIVEILILTIAMPPVLYGYIKFVEKKAHARRLPDI
ncbi:heterokaryon incompatibility protein-domain-containing protein [Xylogone sp. PMI_703]|nr:heterokaryon incompatibility protein-domain-containing protein [Xylogone sp. PMI_703]